MLKPHRITSVLLLTLVTGILGVGAGPACYADTPPPPLATGEREAVPAVAKINVPPVRMSGSDSQPNAKQVPTVLSKPQRYVIDSTVPLVVAQFSIDNGLVKIVERKGPRPYAVGNTITPHKADVENEDIVTIPGPFIYEVTHEQDGVAFLEMFPALGKPGADGKPVALTSSDIVRRVLTLGQGPRPPPVEPVEPDSEVRALTAKLLAAYASEPAADKQESVTQLASLCRSVAKSLLANDATVSKLSTQKAFNDQWQAARSSMIDGKIPVVRRSVGEFLDTKWNREEQSAFDVLAKQRAAAALTQVAKALEAVKGAN